MKFLTFLCLLTFSLSYSQNLNNLSGKWKISSHKKNGTDVSLSPCEQGTVIIFGKIYKDKELGVVSFKTDSSCDERETLYYETKTFNGKNYFIVFNRFDTESGYYKHVSGFDIKSLIKEELVLGSIDDTYVYYRVD